MKTSVCFASDSSDWLSACYGVLISFGCEELRWCRTDELWLSSGSKQDSAIKSALASPRYVELFWRVSFYWYECSVAFPEAWVSFLWSWTHELGNVTAWVFELGLQATNFGFVFRDDEVYHVHSVLAVFLSRKIERTRRCHISFDVYTTPAWWPFSRKIRGISLVCASTPVLGMPDTRIKLITTIRNEWQSGESRAVSPISSENSLFRLSVVT